MTLMPDLPEPPKRNYRWPWIVLAAVLLFIALAIVWVSFAVVKVEQERGTRVPVSTGAR